LSADIPFSYEEGRREGREAHEGLRNDASSFFLRAEQRAQFRYCVVQKQKGGVA